MTLTGAVFQLAAAMPGVMFMYLAALASLIGVLWEASDDKPGGLYLLILL
jgi:hypothetical protein